MKRIEKLRERPSRNYLRLGDDAIDITNKSYSKKEKC